MKRIVSLMIAALACMPAAYGETVNHVFERALDGPDGTILARDLRGETLVRAVEKALGE